MKKLVLIMVLVFVASLSVMAWAETTKEETGLDKDAAYIDKSSGTPEGEKMVMGNLKKDFKVDDAVITGLRNQKLGYGEITIVLAMAQKMPGGITDANTSKIMSMRQGPPVMGWGQIAKEMGFKLGPVVSSVHKVEKATRKDMGKMEKAGKHEKMEKPGKMEKMERPAKPERMENKVR